MRVLLVEDEAKLAALVARGLTERGNVVDIAGTGREALRAAGADRYDVVVLDVGLPDLDGFQVCRRMRDAHVLTPVLMLTARTVVADRIAGLQSGADDYLGKPFVFDELVARLHALGRRGPAVGPLELVVGTLRLDPSSRRVQRDGQEIALTARELALLEAFMRRPGRVLSRDQLLDLAWGSASDVGSNVVEVYVRYLREKIDRPFGVESLETVRGAGYRLSSGGRGG